MKLYEKILRKIGLWKETPKPKEPVPEETVYNPLGVKINATVKVDALDYADQRFTCREIRENVVSLGGEQYQMVDYVLQSAPIGQPVMNVRLRVVPAKDSRATAKYRAMILGLYEELAWSQGLQDVVEDDTKKFVVDDDTDPNNVIHDEFWRVNDVQQSYKASLTTIGDKVSTGGVEFWDYSRLTDMDGVETEQFVFVEKNQRDGWFQIWRGSEINAERIEVF